MSRPLITVKTLIAQARHSRTIELPADALVTPAANDWLADCSMPIRRGAAEAEAAEGNGTAARVFLIGDAAHPNIQILRPIMDRLYAPVAFHPCQGHRTGLLQAVDTTCRALATCSQRRAVVLIHNVAIVNCVANKYPNVRAAILPRPSALYGLVNDLALNMLLIENEQMSMRQVQGAIDAFLKADPVLDPAVEAALERLPVASSLPPVACDGNGGSRANR